jgi:hypothetical protein
MGEVPKGLVCGMPVNPKTACRAQLEGHTVYFCSNVCLQEFSRRLGGVERLP